MSRDPSYTRTLHVFAQYGFRKASMAELADAANVSRQTLYNRFQNKQSVLEWATEGVIRESEEHALAALSDLSKPLSERVVGFAIEWLGVHISALQGTPHGAEMFEMAKASKKASLDLSYERCTAALAAVLEAEGHGAQQAADKAFALIMAAKGLMTASTNEQMFEDGLRRILPVLLG